MSTFEALGLEPNILKALEHLGFTQPTPVQEQAIPCALESNSDLIALAQTGTGKTAAFSLPIIQKLDLKVPYIQALILCPTRELCIQITKDIEEFTKFSFDVKTVAVYGGASIEAQINALKRGCQIVVGTPGRVRDLIDRGKLDISSIRFLVLDEADEMLNMGFKEEIDGILESSPEEKQVLLFSATMPKEINAIAQNYMKSPRKIEIGTRNNSNSDVKHVYCVAKAMDRYRALKRIVDISPNMYGIVFCRTRMETQEVATQLMADGYSADSLHGDLSQAQRDYVMGRFRKKTVQLLVATDVAARGIDVDDLTHVLHYKLPDQLEYYIHRSGRTGRAGKKGVSIALISSQEARKIQELERQIGQKFERRLIPTGQEVCEKRLLSLVEKVAAVETDNDIEPFLPAIMERLEGFDKEELIKKFVSMEFKRFFDYYKEAGDLNAVSGRDRNEKSHDRDNNRDRDDRNRDRDRNRNEKGERGFSKNASGGGLARFYINVGSKHNITAAKMIGLIKDSLRTKNIEIGKIEIMKGFSMFEIDASHEQELLGGFRKGMQVAGVNVVVERTSDRTEMVEKQKDRGAFKYKKEKEKTGYPKKEFSSANKYSSGKSFSDKPKKKRRD